MKKILSVCLLLCLVLALPSCGTKMEPVENALIAAKTLDVEAFASHLTSDTDIAFARMQENFASLTEEEKGTLRSLYALIQYTVGDVTEADDEKTMSVKVKHPDMERVKTLGEKKLLVSADTAANVVSEMLESGEIAGHYMLDETFEVVMTQEDGVWKVSYTAKENEAFFGMLYFAEMFSFFAQH